MLSRIMQGAMAVLLGSVLLAACHSPAQTQTHDSRASGQAAIASAHHLATEAGHEVLARGGNAFDAAVAVAAVLSVVEPESSGIGGGGFFLLHRARDGMDIMVDARETAPAASTPELYLDEDGELDRDRSINGPLAAGIPGQPAALVHLSGEYGNLPLKDSLEPAIRIARAGFVAEADLLRAIGVRREVLQRYPASARLFLVDGEVPAEGWKQVNEDLADTLERLGEHGNDGFYAGEMARRLVDGVRGAGGNWTLEDLRDYQLKERQPISFEYRGNRIVTAAPPSSGGVALAQMLNILSGYDLQSMDGVERAHLMVEAMRRAYRDRAQYMGDPDHVEMPIAQLTSPLYAAGLRASIHPHKALPSDFLAGYLPLPGGEHTTHFSIIDADGNMVAATTTVNLPLGAGMVVEGTGFLLNNEMDDFALKPGTPNAFGLVGNAANAPAAGRRPLSSMTPTFVFGEQRTGVIGTPGGSRIITMVLQGVLGFVEGKSAAQIVALPRFHHQYLPDVISTEPGAFEADQVRALEAMGHIVNAGERRWGLMNVVIRDRQSNRLDAAADPRSSAASGTVK